MADEADKRTTAALDFSREGKGINLQNIAFTHGRKVQALVEPTPASRSGSG